MTPTIGFVLITHNKPHQTIRLVNTLNLMFDYPRIVCHHDFSKSDLPTEIFTKNVSFIHPHIQTGWSKFSLVEATFSGIKMMYERPDSPDWFVLLSGADYPVKPAHAILNDLSLSLHDVHVHHEKISYNNYEREWQELCYDRYCAVKFRIPSINRRSRFFMREISLKNPIVTSLFTPFSKKFHCFSGGQWFSANRKAAQYLTEFYRKKPRLASYYRKLDSRSICPDESYFQTVFCNAPSLKISQENWRYIDWSTQGLHPKILSIEDLHEIRASSAHFGRKFDPDVDSHILDELDHILGTTGSPSTIVV